MHPPRAPQRGRHGRAPGPGVDDASADAEAPAADPAWLLEAPVSDVMSGSPWFTHPGAPLAEAAATMTRHAVNRLPVVDHGRLVGILARADVVAALADEGGAGGGGEGEGEGGAAGVPGGVPPREPWDR
jgi:CBS domain-containing protein